MLKKGFLIELNDIPKIDDDICIETANYCVANNLNFEFLRRIYPVVAIIDEHKYEITKKLQRVKLINCWVLKCKEID